MNKHTKCYNSIIGKINFVTSLNYFFIFQEQKFHDLCNNHIQTNNFCLKNVYTFSDKRNVLSKENATKWLLFLVLWASANCQFGRRFFWRGPILPVLNKNKNKKDNNLKSWQVPTYLGIVSNCPCFKLVLS